MTFHQLAQTPTQGIFTPIAMRLKNSFNKINLLMCYSSRIESTCLKKDTVRYLDSITGPS